MTDIVERLRDIEGEWADAEIREEAADEIERLTGLLENSEMTVRELLANDGRLREAVEGLLVEWDKLTRYGSPIVKAANERVTAARAALEPTP
jgi:hypothetical protein